MEDTNQIEQRICQACKGRFFFEKDVDIEFYGYTLCSYCFDKCLICVICGGLIITNKHHKKQVFSVCEKCIEKYDLKNCNNLFVKTPKQWFDFVRFLVFKRDNFTCRYCGRSPLKDSNVELQCDHIIPKSKGGTDFVENLITACKECNYAKSSMVFDEKTINLIKNRRIYLKVEKENPFSDIPLQI